MNEGRIAPWRLWTALVPAMVLPFLAALMYFVVLSGDHRARVLYAGTKVFMAFWPVFAVQWILHGRLPVPRLLDVRHLKALPLGLVTGAGAVLLMLGLLHGPLGPMVAAHAAEIRAKAAEFGILDHYWLFAVTLSVLHSLLEEFYWRWFVFGKLRAVVPRPAAHLMAGAAFALHHVVVVAVFFSLGWGLVLGAMVGVGGIVWSLLYDRQGTLTGAWLSHTIVDLGIMVVGYGLIFGK